MKSMKQSEYLGPWYWVQAKVVLLIVLVNSFCEINRGF